MWRVPDVRATTAVSEAYRRWVRISDPRDHDRLRAVETGVPLEISTIVAGKRKIVEQAAAKAHAQGSIFKRLDAGEKTKASCSVFSRLREANAPRVFDRLCRI